MPRDKLKDEDLEDLLDDIFGDPDEDEYFEQLSTKSGSSKRRIDARRKIEQIREDRELQRRLDDSYL